MAHKKEAREGRAYKYNVGDTVHIRGDGILGIIVKQHPIKARAIIPDRSYTLEVKGRGKWHRFEHELSLILSADPQRSVSNHSNNNATEWVTRTEVPEIRYRTVNHYVNDLASFPVKVPEAVFAFTLEELQTILSWVPCNDGFHKEVIEALMELEKCSER